MRGIVSYRLSPFEQKAFAGLFSKGFPNVVRRFRESVFRVAPPFIIGYLVYDQTEKLHSQMMRKNPADFENDK
ncbi:Ubiquinol-cytochrome c reductase ubiquinone-binding protein [Carabus blaptoides fortunei]